MDERSRKSVSVKIRDPVKSSRLKGRVAMKKPKLKIREMETRRPITSSSSAMMRSTVNRRRSMSRANEIPETITIGTMLEGHAKAIEIFSDTDDDDMLMYHLSRLSFVSLSLLRSPVLFWFSTRTHSLNYTLRCVYTVAIDPVYSPCRMNIKTSQISRNIQKYSNRKRDAHLSLNVASWDNFLEQE